jgi:hypothetical protein
LINERLKGGDAEQVIGEGMHKKEMANLKTKHGSNAENLIFGM